MNENSDKDLLNENKERQVLNHGRVVFWVLCVVCLIGILVTGAIEVFVVNRTRCGVMIGNQSETCTRPPLDMLNTVLTLADFAIQPISLMFMVYALRQRDDPIGRNTVKHRLPDACIVDGTLNTSINIIECIKYSFLQKKYQWKSIFVFSVCVAMTVVWIRVWFIHWQDEGYLTRLYPQPGHIAVCMAIICWGAFNFCVLILLLLICGDCIAPNNDMLKFVQINDDITVEKLENKMKALSEGIRHQQMFWNRFQPIYLAMLALHFVDLIIATVNFAQTYDDQRVPILGMGWKFMAIASLLCPLYYMSSTIKSAIRHLKDALVAQTMREGTARSDCSDCIIILNDLQQNGANIILFGSLRVGWPAVISALLTAAPLILRFNHIFED